jgi:hypothetical protein
MDTDHVFCCRPQEKERKRTLTKLRKVTTWQPYVSKSIECLRISQNRHQSILRFTSQYNNANNGRCGVSSRHRLLCYFANQHRLPGRNASSIVVLLLLLSCRERCRRLFGALAIGCLFGF